MKAVSITGLGAVTSAGTDSLSFWENVLHEKSGIAETGLGVISDVEMAALRERAPDIGSLSKSAFIAMVSIRDAMKQAGWSSLREDDGLIIASTVGQIPLWENSLVHFLKKEIKANEFGKTISHQSLGSLVEVISKELGFHGKSMLVTSACSAATQAIGLASLWIHQGRVKRCLVGGTEVLSRLTVEGFRSLQLLSSQSCSPFDQNRQGINLSEGAAFFCLEPSSERDLALVSGVGFSTDAYHMAAPHPEGRGSFEAMSGAVTMASISPGDVTWVHAHGTGSKANDQSEGAAIAQLFGSHKPWVSSTKGIHGHALGASGAIETALCVQAIQNRKILRTSGLTTPDPLINVRHPDQHISTEIRHILKNTLGFGGNNAALVLSAKGVR